MERDFEHYRPQDYEQLRDYLLGHLPGLIRHMLSLMPSQNQLAREVGVSKGTLSQWLSGERKPKPENLAKLLDVLTRHFQIMLMNLESARGEMKLLQEAQEKLEEL